MTENTLQKHTNNLPAQLPKSDVETYIMSAIEKGASVDVIERLLAMRETLRKEVAKQEYDKAFSKFQAACPVIKKDTPVLNKDKATVRYSYAQMDSIINQIKVPLAVNGFSYSLTSKLDLKGDKHWLTATAKLSHIGGHSEISEFEIPIDKDAFMNEQQKFASARTFAMRYAFLGVTGIMTGDQDDDGNQTPIKGKVADDLPPEQTSKPDDKQEPTKEKSSAENKTVLTGANLTRAGKDENNRELQNSPGCISAPGIVHCEVKDVRIKTGTSSRGPWTMYSIEIDNVRYGTFDTKDGQRLLDAEDREESIKFTYTETKQGMKITPGSIISLFDEEAHALEGVVMEGEPDADYK